MNRRSFLETILGAFGLTPFLPKRRLKYIVKYLKPNGKWGSRKVMQTYAEAFTQVTVGGGYRPAERCPTAEIMAQTRIEKMRSELIRRGLNRAVVTSVQKWNPNDSIIVL